MQPIDVMAFLAQNRGLIIRLSKRFNIPVGDVEGLVALVLLEHAGKWNPARGKLETFILFKSRKLLGSHRPGLGFGGGGGDEDGDEEELAAPDEEEIEAWRLYQGDDAFEARLDWLREQGTAGVAKVSGVSKRQGRNLVNRQAERFAQGDLFTGVEK